MTYDMSWREVEKVLYVYPEIQLLLRLLNRTDTQFVAVAGRREGPGDPVAAVCQERANLRAVADIVDGVMETLTKAERALIRSKYFARKTWREAARDAEIAERTAYEWRDRLIPRFQAAFRVLDDRKVAVFWQTYCRYFAVDKANGA